MSKKIIAAFGIVGFLASAGLAFARTATVSTTSSATVSAPEVKGEAMMLEVGREGRVLLRGTISSVSSGSVTVKSWGGDWTVNVSSSAKVLPQGAALSSFKTGDFVGVQGTVSQSGAWTVDATLVRDWTDRQVIHQQITSNEKAVREVMSAAPRTIQGSISGLDSTARTFTLTTGNGKAYSVSLDSSVKLLSKNWATLDFTKVSSGDTVRVYGTIASSTITASIFRDISVK